MPNILIADSGATKCEWRAIINGTKKKFSTQGISPYFLTEAAIIETVEKNVAKKLQNATIDAVYFYGTGLSNKENERIIIKSLKKVFTNTKTIEANTDLLAAARALCGTNKGIACILGTGSNSCYYNGKKVVKNSPGLGYVLGDEGSGAYLGRKVLQYFLYNTYDEELMARFVDKFNVSSAEILNNVYKQPFPSRYLASFAIFLAENRGHYMIENIIEDAFNDFFFNHLYKYRESWTHPINFVGSVAYGFRDVLKDMCNSYELELGKVLKAPMDGLILFHNA